ncbi:MAG: hypothetical protein P8H62_08825 [Henriciella sp.]|nr:hypothetical protein [Henriciella sp.]
MTQHTFKSARKRYQRVFWPLMGVYVVAVLGGSYYLSTLEVEPTWLKTVIAIAVTLPIVAALFAMLRYFDETDEYSRLFQLRSFATGAVITISAIFAVGFLQIFEVIGSVDVFWFGPLFFVCYGLAHRLTGGRDC